ncbi:MAG: amino acid permease, partial [Deltaproteobacteria bacterium]|nr:amino acid permease [Deltaproteobacteria bacterium]
FNQLLAGLGLQIPVDLATDLRTALASPEILAQAPHIGSIPIVCNLPAALIVLLLTWILVTGIKESARFNVLMVLIKLFTLGLFVFAGFFYIRPENWHPFMPNGWAGVQAGAAVIFFAYIGFDAVSTVAEECRNPAKDMPIGIIGSLVICTVIYVVVAAVLTGILPFSQLNVPDPLSLALHSIGRDRFAGLVAVGAIISMTAVLLVFQLGQPRIFFSMARDGLLPPWFAKVHPKHRTPHVATILTGLVVAMFAAFARIDEMVDLTNIGTLFAFILVCGGILVLRIREPHLHRPFRVPLFPWVPILGIFSCLYLMTGLPQITWVRFGIWLLVGLVFYAAYGLKKSRLTSKT